MESKMSIRTPLLSCIASVGLLITASFPGAAAPLLLQRPLYSVAAESAPLIRVHDRQRYDSRRGFYTWNGYYYYNGHRGYRTPRRGYRSYNGFWFPPAAFGFRIMPAPRYVPPPRYGRGLSQAHYRWCDNRYRSYRGYDNTFQPYNGPRKPCVSPYWP